MKTFIFMTSVVVSIQTRIEAESIEEALEQLQEVPMMNMPNMHDYEEKYQWVCDVLDGEPRYEKMTCQSVEENSTYPSMNYSEEDLKPLLKKANLI
jgi:adenosine deaminase